MSKESIHENGPSVKRKAPQAAHEVENGFAPSIRELQAGMDPSCVGKTRRGRLNNSAYHIKKAALAWADAFPKKINGDPTGFTPAVREVFKAVVWSHLMDRGYAVFSYETLADAAGCDSRQTVWRAVNYLRKRGLIQVKTGRGWGQKERRSLANQYTANFWVFINPETGTIVDPPYHTGIYEWEMTAAGFRCRLENVTMVSKLDAGLPGVGEKADHSNKLLLRSDQENGVTTPKDSNKMLLYRGNDRGAKNAAPIASVDTAANGSATRPGIESGIGVPLPWNTENDSVVVDYIFAKDLAAKMGLPIEKVIGGEGGAALNALCKSELFNFTMIRTRVFDQARPNGGTPYGHIRITEDAGEVTFVEGGTNRIDLDKIQPTDLLVIEYILSAKTLADLTAKIKAQKGY